MGGSSPKLVATGGGAVFDLSGYGLVAATDDPITFMGSSTIGNNQIFYTRCWVPAGKPLTGLWVSVKTANVHDGATDPNQLAVYADDGATRLGLTADDRTLWTATGWRGGAIVGGPVAASAVGRFVYVGVLCRGMNGAPVISFPASSADWDAFYTGPGETYRRGFYVGANAFPATIDPTSTGTASGYVPLLGIS